MAICNTNLLMVSFITYRLADEIKRLFPRLDTRVKKFQTDLRTMMISATTAMSSSPLIVAQILRFRDFRGRSVITLLLETKVYEFLEVRVIEAAIRTFWLGKTNFSGYFMQQSTAFDMLF